MIYRTAAAARRRQGGECRWNDLQAKGTRGYIVFLNTIDTMFGSPLYIHISLSELASHLVFFFFPIIDL